jgi:hypothetical protein
MSNTTATVEYCVRKFSITFAANINNKNTEQNRHSTDERIAR